MSIQPLLGRAVRSGKTDGLVASFVHRLTLADGHVVATGSRGYPGRSQPMRSEGPPESHPTEMPILKRLGKFAVTTHGLGPHAAEKPSLSSPVERIEEK